MISLVVPCYNEEGNVENFIASVREELQGLDYEVIFINDGSRDHTREKLDEIVAHSKDAVTAIHFSRNFGKEAGIYAGLQHATGEYTVIIDADLQQPVQVAREMVEFLEDHEDYDGVAAYQDTRKESKLMIWFKKRFYHLMNRLCDVELQENDSDFRCMRRNMVDAILELSEYHRFSKGIFAWGVYKVDFRPYEVQ